MRRGHDPPRWRLNGPTASLRGEGDGTSAKEANGGMDCLSAAAMTDDVGVAVGLWLCFMVCYVKKFDGVRM